MLLWIGFTAVGDHDWLKKPTRLLPDQSDSKHKLTGTGQTRYAFFAGHLFFLRVVFDCVVFVRLVIVMSLILVSLSLSQVNGMHHYHSYECDQGKKNLCPCLYLKPAALSVCFFP